MEKKVLCLTPECSKLWPIRPGLCFLYDSIIIDSKDYEGILASQDDSTYNFLVARNIERLRMEGILQIESYSRLLTSKDRKAIRESASKHISALDQKKQIELTIQSHKDYSDYLEAQLLFCETDEWKYKWLVTRLNSVRKRLDLIGANPRMTEETEEALKRIAAKSIAGSLVVSHFNGAHLFDTSEYRPFIDTMTMDDIYSKSSPVKYHDEVENTAMDIIAAIIFNKKLPDITVYDDHSLTQFLKTREELEVLRDILREIVERYYELIGNRPEKAQEHLYLRFKEALSKIDRTVAHIKGQRDIIWKITEILATIKCSILIPFLEPLKEKNLKIHRRNELRKVKVEDELLANLIFVFDHVQFGNKRYDIGLKKTFRQPETLATKIWGEKDSYLPWYECD